MKLYKHLGIEERAKIVILQDQGFTVGEIAAELGRHRSTIHREITRNSNIETGEYVARDANTSYRRRLSVPQGRIRDTAIKSYVIDKLKNGWSPERISGRIAEELPGKSISTETIYMFVYKEEPGFRGCLTRHHMKRHLKGQRKTHTKGRIPNKTSIELRPKQIDERKQVGHWESDTMAGLQKKNSGLTFTVERKTRLTKIYKLRVITARHNRRNIMKSLRSVPEGVRLSITYDNGKENVEHEKINKQIGCKSYFCHEKSPYEKGTVENTIGLARRIYPKGTDFDMISSGRIKELENWLNNLPRKCLGWKTPNEAFNKMCCT